MLNQALKPIATSDAIAMRALEGSRAPAVAFAAGETVGRIKVTEPVHIDKAIEAFDGFKDAKRFWPKGPKPEPDAKPS